MSAIEIRVPAIGDFKDVGVIDVLVKPGQSVKADASLVTLESDKATMDVPSPVAGTVAELKVKVGDRVREGSVILLLEESGRAVGAAAPTAAPPQAAIPTAPQAAIPTAPPPAAPARAPTSIPPLPVPTNGRAHASPAVRAVARELGVDLSRVAGSGPHGRILREDVHRFVKEVVGGASPVAAPAGGGLDLLPWPKVDFARFGPVEARPLSRIRKISAANLARNWVMIPHVTQHEEADITELEAFRKELNAEQPVKVTVLALLMKALVPALQAFPELNASLDGESLVLKRYYHLGFAADTPGGLLVPVLRDADRKGVLAIARELGELAAKAREGKLTPAEMQGGSFSISSLGGIGGTSFTPIVNAPEVAILGVSRSALRPHWDGERFVPRLMLPLSLSYDHRVVDGALGARFLAHLAGLLADLRRGLL